MCRPAGKFSPNLTQILLAAVVLSVLLLAVRVAPAKASRR